MRAPSSELPVVLENVSLRSGATSILEDLNQTIAHGAPTLIVGPNGAGKTSLLRLCMGLTAPSSGRITWGGRTDRAPLRRAIVFQRPVMLRRSASANIAYALAQADVPRKARAARIAELLERVGLAELARRPARHLSSGEQQRLALARAILLKPDWLFLDEATASLDPEAEAELYATLRERLPTTTFVSISHRPAVTGMHERHLVFERLGDQPGRLAEAA